MSLVGFAWEWDFFFLRFCFFTRSGASLSLLERYERSVHHRPSFLEVYLVFQSLYILLVRLLSLPLFYHRIGVSNPYLGRELISQSALSIVDMCHSNFNS